MQKSFLIWLCAVAAFFINRTSTLTLSSTVSLKNETYSESSLNYRLPNDTYPEHYNITLTTYIDTSETTYLGEVVIDIVVVNTTESVVLHAGKLEIFIVYLESPSTGESEELSREYELKREFLTLKRQNGRKFAAESKWKLTFIYTGVLRSDNNGFFWTKFVDDEGNDHYLAATHFERANARHAFPCYDEPNKRANFTITINHSPSLTAISNMPVNEARSRAGHTEFLTAARFPTYLVSFVVCDFEYIDGMSNGVQQRVYSPSKTKHEHSYALESALKILEYMTEYLGVAYTLPKLDHVSLPVHPHEAAEIWGLITYLQENLRYTADTASYMQTNIVKRMAHEIAHQWFGNYVTIEWWTYLWLKEGFATLFSFKAMDKIFPEFDIWQDFHVNEYQKALDISATQSSTPVTFFVPTPSELPSSFEDISYVTACSLLLMWNSALTEKVFQKAVQKYIKDNQFSAAAEEQLFAAFRDAAEEEKYELPAPISVMIGSWTHQSGYPILTVTRNYTDGTFTVNQAAFQEDGTFAGNKTWYVPINYAVASSADFLNTAATHYLKNVTDMKVDVKIARKDWLMINKQSHYFYRVKYDAENYNLITKSLIKSPHKIHPRNRAQLMDDAYILTMSNHLDHGILLKMLTYLKKEQDYAPWLTAGTIIGKLYRYLKNNKDFKSFLAELVTPIYEKLGVDGIPGEKVLDKKTRAVVIDIACKTGVKKCLVDTNNKLKNVAKNNTPLDVNLKIPIYIHGVKQAGDKEFNFMYQKLMNSTDENSQEEIVYGISFVQNHEHIKKLLSTSIDKSNKLTSEQRKTLLNNICVRSEMSFFSCIDFLRANWRYYGSLTYENEGSKPLDALILRMTTQVTKKTTEETLLALVAEVKDSEYVSSSLQSRVYRKIAANYEWLQRHGIHIKSWISKNRICMKRFKYSELSL